MADPIVINIASEKLLDVIMQGDPKAILAVKKGILDNWAHKNIRPKIDHAIANSIINDMDAQVRKSIKKTMDEHFKYEELEPYIREQTVKVIDKMINEELAPILQKRVKDLVDKALKKIK